MVLGATGGIGYAYTNELLRNGIEVSILAREREKAEHLFNRNPLLQIHEGDINDPGILNSSTQDADVIFFGINYPYHLWDKYMRSITSMVIKAAGQNRATILFPGNIYSFGNLKDPGGAQMGLTKGGLFGFADGDIPKGDEIAIFTIDDM